MSISLLGFLTLVEERTRPLLPAAGAWRFQRLIDFKRGEAVLQLWRPAVGAEAETLAGVVQLREAPREAGATSFSGTVQGAGAAAKPQTFAFAPETEEDAGPHAGEIAKLWQESIGGKEEEATEKPPAKKAPSKGTRAQPAPRKGK